MLNRVVWMTGIYVISFSFFSLVLHAVASAMTTVNSIQEQESQNEKLVPTPTIFIYTGPTTPTFLPTAIPTKTPIPTPTAVPTFTLTPTMEPTFTPQPTVGVVNDLDGLFQKYSDEYHVDRELLKRIARCESGFNSQADTGLYAGMFQFASQTWITARSGMGLDSNPDLRKNAEESIRTAAYMIGAGGQNAWAGCL